MKIEERGKDQKMGNDTNVKLPNYTSAKQGEGKFIILLMKKITKTELTGLSSNQC